MGARAILTDLGEIPMDAVWRDRLAAVDYAFQPIVNIHTGACYGCETLLRDTADAGFDSIAAFFDAAHADGMLYPVELALREKAVAKFARRAAGCRMKMFFNLDNRVLRDDGYRSGNTLDMLRRLDFPIEGICFEISERHEIRNAGEAARVLDVYRAQGFKIAVDDCGAGFAGFKLLYFTRPDFIKIDRFFIKELAEDPRKRLFVASLVNIAHLMGAVVIAEGIETEREYFSCREIGCDMIQGFLVCRPERDPARILPLYQPVPPDRRRCDGDERRIETVMSQVPTVSHECDVRDVIKMFRQNRDATFFPVVNDNGEVLGVVSEKSLKEFTYSRFGGDLLQNPSISKDIQRFITRYPIADIRTPAEKVLEIYSQNENMEGILIVDDLRYRGFLSAHCLLKVLNEKNIAVARDQNPLTRLPGNTLIHAWVSEALRNRSESHVMVYYDFNDFKPYNDYYGFRNGDRVILMFADLIRSRAQFAGHFAGHIGGDDFFVGFAAGTPLKKAMAEARAVIRRFANDVESFYDPESIRRGWIDSTDRDGNPRRFDLLTVSAVALHLPAGRDRVYSTEEISVRMALEKKKAKRTRGKLRLLRMEGGTDFNDTGCGFAPARRFSQVPG